MNINNFWMTAGEFDPYKVLIWGGLALTLLVGFALLLG